MMWAVALGGDSRGKAGCKKNRLVENKFNKVENFFFLKNYLFNGILQISLTL